MADIVNLRRARKVKARWAAEAEATANRAKFGRSKAERAVAESEERRALRLVEGHRIGEDDLGGGDA